MLRRVKGVEPQSVFDGRFAPAHRQNPREYVSIHSVFFSIRPKSARHKLLRTEKEIVFKDFSVQRSQWGPRKAPAFWGEEESPHEYESGHA